VSEGGGPAGLWGEGCAWRVAARRLVIGLGLAAIFAAAVRAQVQSEDIPGATPTPTPPRPAVISSGGTLAGEAAAEERYAAGDLEGAAALYRQLAVVTGAPRERLRLLVAAAWLEHQLQRGAEAFELLRQGLTDVPDYPFQPQNYSQDFVDIYVKARERALADRRQRAKDLVQRSLQESAADDLGRARASLVQALALAPDDPFALYYLALAEMKAGRRDEAVAGFERVLAVEATRPGTVPAEVRSSALASLGKLYYEKGLLEDAQRYLEQAVALEPDSPRIWNTLGLTHRKSGDAAGAERAFRQALALSPESGEAANNLALVLFDAQRWPESVALLGGVTTRDPTDTLGWLNLGLAQRGAGDRARARASLQRVIALDGQNRAGLAASAATYLAIVAYEDGDAAGAVAAARQALAWRQDDVVAWTYLGLSQQLQKDYAGARESFQRALALDPARPENHNNLGTALLLAGDLAGAEAAFRQALTIRPGFTTAQANLDQVLVRQVAAKAGDGAATPPKADPGKPRRQPKPLGVRFSDADFTYLDLHGAVVESVSGQSPAERAGLRRGDVVLGVDGNRIEGPQHLLRYLRNLTGERDYVEIDILREGQPKRIKVDMF
jgi:tetratricopeptide (TPR) repeat protein